jgi:hypothetical protein
MSAIVRGVLEQGMGIFRPEQLITAPGRAGILCRFFKSGTHPWSRSTEP